MSTPISDEVANIVVAQLLFLQSENSQAGISLHLNSTIDGIIGLFAEHTSQTRETVRKT